MNTQTLVAAGGVAVCASGLLLAVAPAARAGCEQQVFAAYCDGPVRADGTWDRCMQTQPQPFYGGRGQIAGWIPSTGRCYPVDPNDLPPMQPSYHIYP